MHRTTIERRLSDAHERLVRARAELAVLDEQLVVVNEIADDTRLRALVAETPVASKEHDEASRQAAAMVQTRAGAGRADRRARAPPGRAARPTGGRPRLRVAHGFVDDEPDRVAPYRGRRQCRAQSPRASVRPRAGRTRAP